MTCWACFEAALLAEVLVCSECGAKINRGNFWSHKHHEYKYIEELMRK